MKPRSDLVLQIASTSEVAKTQAASYTGTLVELRRLSATTVQFGVEIANRAELAFLPGQYVNIAVPGASPDGNVTRSYSFSNAPHEERLTFMVKLTPGGAMSDYLANRAAVGETIGFTGPHGSFFLRESERPVLLLAGGTGLAPILSLVRKLRTVGSQRKAHLVYGVSTDEDLVAVDQLQEVAAGLTGFTWDHCVADPASTAVNKGYVTGLIRPEHLYDGDVAIYIDVGRVEETHSGLDGGTEHVQCRGLAHLAPVRTELPGAQPDDRDGTISTTEYAFLHTPYPTNPS